MPAQRYRCRSSVLHQAFFRGYPSTMGRLGDRLGKLDDKSVIYRAGDPAQKVEWRRFGVAYVLGTVLAGLFIAGADHLVGQPFGSLVVICLAVVLVIMYVLWRRRRNKRLTGSATTWPSP